MTRNLKQPFLPIPPSQYQQQYFDTLIRNFAVYLDQIQQPGEGRGTGLVLTNLQTNDLGLEVGELFNWDGYIKITQANVVHLSSNVATTAVGTVTVTIS